MNLNDMSPRDARNFLVLMEADRIEEQWSGYVVMVCWLWPGGQLLQGGLYGLGASWWLEGALFSFLVGGAVEWGVWGYLALLALGWVRVFWKLHSRRVRTRRQSRGDAA